MSWVFAMACIGMLLVLGEMVARYLKEVEGTRRQGQETHLQIEANLKAIEEARKETEEVRSRVLRAETEVQSLKEKLTKGVAEEIELEGRELKRNTTRHKLEDTESDSDD